MRNVVILTGAGVSAESGVATFRAADGVWAKYDYREVATPEGFAANPSLVHEFYNERRRNLSSVSPNSAHIALARLEMAIIEQGGKFTLITQNVDNLHERANSKNVLHMHGELAKAECSSCGFVFHSPRSLSIDMSCDECNRAGGLRPFVVWFGEIPRFMDESMDAIKSADLFVAIGTSGSVYPAAGFVMEARKFGATTIELNLEPSENADVFSHGYYGKATEIVPAWVNSLID